MNFIISVIFLVFCEISFIDSSRILILFPTPSKSHLIAVQGLSTTLAEKGHDVTVISPFPMGKNIKNYRDIKSPLSEEAASFADDMLKNPNRPTITNFPNILRITTGTAKDLMETPEYKKILKEEKFDLVVIGMFMSNFLLGVGDHFKCPTMMLSASGAFTATNLLFGNPLEVSAVPHIKAYKAGKMNFLDRVKNFVAYGFDLTMNLYVNHVQKQIYDEYFPSDRYISYDAALKNLSMILLNTHFTQGSVRPYVPAMVQVGGLNVKPKPDPLPTDIQQFLDGAKDGAIFFSFGSNAKTTFLPKEKIAILLKVFSKLKQRVVMKWESDSMEGKPENVFIGKWLPQDDILAHKNVKLFISHCGLGSTVESKYHAVPIVGVPLFADQSANTDVVVGEGWGVKVDFASLTEESLYGAIKEVLENPKYKSTVDEISQLYRDRPMNARETAAYWVEYIIRHRGAPHLQYQAVHLNLLQSTSLDVIAFLTVTIYVAFKVFVAIFKLVLRKIFGAKPLTGKNKKRN